MPFDLRYHARFTCLDCDTHTKAFQIKKHSRVAVAAEGNDHCWSRLCIQYLIGCHPEQHRSRHIKPGWHIDINNIQNKTSQNYRLLVFLPSNKKPAAVQRSMYGDVLISCEDPVHPCSLNAWETSPFPAKSSMNCTGGSRGRTLQSICSIITTKSCKAAGDFQRAKSRTTMAKTATLQVLYKKQCIYNWDNNLYGHCICVHCIVGRSIGPLSCLEQTI